MFYAGTAYKYKQEKAEAQSLVQSMKDAGIPYSEIPNNSPSKSMINPVGEAVQDGYQQEMGDKLFAKWSSYSYEDLPTDKFAADFGG
jgi:hypothetical protein